MAKIYCIVNQKGGVGKTTTAVNLAASLALLEKKTLLVDCDPQGNATTGMGIDKTGLKNSLYHGMIEKTPAESLITTTEIESLDVIPSRVELIGYEVEMMSHPEREKGLKRLIQDLSDQYEYILLDCPPSLSLLTINAMTAADGLLIPLQCEFYALEGLGQLIETYKRVRSSFNRDLALSGILLTMFDKRTNLSYQVAEDARKYFKKIVFKTVIPRNVRLGEAPSYGKPIILYDATSSGAVSYLELAKEIMDRNGAKEQRV